MCQSGVGSVCDAIAVSYEQIIIDNELIGNIYHSLSLLEEDDDFGFEAIQDVVENNGSYLTHESTMDYLRSPEKYPINGKLSNYQGYEQWHTAGKKDMAANAAVEVERILEEHQETPIDKQMADELDRIFDQAAD